MSEEPESPLAHKTRPESRASTVLEDITEESYSDDDVSMVEPFAALDLDIATLTTHELLTAAVREAKSSLHAHLNTVNTTLELLWALNGFSATITAMKGEMEATKEICEEKLKAIEDVERAVECMRFEEE